MADHLDAPGLMPPGGDPRIDITDIYAFQKPGDAARSILIMNVNPLTLASEFNPDAIYELKVDADGDARANLAFRITFSAKSSDVQTATVRLASGSQAVGRSGTGTVIISGAPVSFGPTPQVTTQGSFSFFAGVRSDPFFFDLLGFLNGFKFTGSDFFLDKNVYSMALDVPNSALGSNPNIGTWGRTLLPQSDGSLLQIDRMGRPAINTVFMHGKEKLMFNRAEPVQDRARFTDEIVAVLTSFGYTTAQADDIAAILLPDILTYDDSSSNGFLNGRNLTDDVIDIELTLVTNGQVTGDGVGAHTDLLGSFPFMGTPHS
jgi:hypothetical protein